MFSHPIYTHSNTFHLPAEWSMQFLFLEKHKWKPFWKKYKASIPVYMLLDNDLKGSEQTIALYRIAFLREQLCHICDVNGFYLSRWIFNDGWEKSVAALWQADCKAVHFVPYTECSWLLSLPVDSHLALFLAVLEDHSSWSMSLLSHAVFWQCLVVVMHSRCLSVWVPWCWRQQCIILSPNSWCLVVNIKPSWDTQRVYFHWGVHDTKKVPDRNQFGPKEEDACAN